MKLVREAAIPNYLTIDFEDWYQGLTSTSTNLDKWDDYEKRLEIGAGWLLATLEAHAAKATFFIVGQVAREHPHLVCRIVEKGHRLALHGNKHQLIYKMTREEFREDLRNNLEAIKNACGVLPSGYRAPCFSITKQTTWFWEELAAYGLNFDSSVFPISNPLYGFGGCTPYAAHYFDCVWARTRVPREHRTPAGGQSTIFRRVLLSCFALPIDQGADFKPEQRWNARCVLFPPLGVRSGPARLSHYHSEGTTVSLWAAARD